MENCPNCAKAIHFEASSSSAYPYPEAEGDEKGLGFAVTHGFCPACSNLIVLLQEGKYKKREYGGQLLSVISDQLLYPKCSSRLVQPEVPDYYKEEYLEAASVLQLSPKASAAISRRLLQCVLREDLKIKKSSLANEINDFLENKTVPTYLSEAIDAIRSVGNFAAHPEKDVSTGELVDVEDGEAEWLLEVLDSLFDFVFVQPKRLEERKKSLNIKLSKIGKPPVKGAKR